MSLDLDAIEARASAATPGPWERGDIWLEAGVGFGDGPGRCAFCGLGEPTWTGRMAINGRRMAAHRHRREPYEPDHRISGANGTAIAGNYDYEVGGIIEAADTEFIAHARTDVPALVAEVRRLRRALERIGARDYTPGEVIASAALAEGEARP